VRAPDFWSAGNGGWRAALLRPAGALYAWATARRVASGPGWRAPVPVVSVGNLVAGGAGKTPVVMDLCERLQTMGRAPAVVLRGFGGTERGPLRVDPGRHDARAVGDEALLHAVRCPTWVSPDRRAGVEGAIADAADVVLLDDAHQNAAVAAALRFVVVDGAYGFGNGCVLPAGPLREPVAAGMARADAVIMIGADETDARRMVPGGVPVLVASIQPTADWRDRRVVAFAGLGRPEKVFRTLREAGADVMSTQAFADHHPYDTADIRPLMERARNAGAALVTTTKDHVRLPEAVRDAVETIDVRLVWRDPDALAAQLSGIL
jgi:tetraacyldisaccharide 4'-kinase